MDNQEAIKTLRELRRETNDPWYEEVYEKAVSALEKQIPKELGSEEKRMADLIEQIRWERDVAIQQLKELGYGLGEKIRTDGDTISRQAAVEAFCCEGSVFVYGRDVCKAIVSRIMQIPSAQRWIPCSERLPKPESKEQRRGFYLTTNGYGSVGMTRYEFYDDFQKTGWQSEIRIDAWMPLPDPWRGGEP